jgi:MFS family permease
MSKVAQPATKTARHESDVRGYPHFMTVLGGQTISVFGSQMAAFAISIWIYHETGSVLQFGAVIAAQLLPAVIFAPLSGVMVDRYRRKNVMIASEVALIAVSLLIYAVISAGKLTPTTILVFFPLMGLFGSVHQIAYASSIPLLVPRAAYGRANGYVQVGINGSAAVVPLISVIVLEGLGLGAVILLNVATYVVAVVSLMFAKFADIPERARAATGSGLKQLLSQQSFGVRYIWSHRTLLVLVVFMGAVSFLSGMVLVLFRPMILSTESATVLGWLVTIAGIGGLAGAVVAATVSRRSEKVHTLLVASAVSGLSMVWCGLSTNLVLLAALVFVFSFSAPFILVAAQTLMQTITPTEIQGRVFASRAALAGIALITAVIFSPMLAENLFGPWMREGHMLAPVADLLDAGKSAGMRVVFILAGLAMVLLSAVSVQGRHFRALRRQIQEGELLAPTPA